MFYVLAFLIGVVVGAICMFLYFMDWRASAKVREVELAQTSKKIRESLDMVEARQREVSQIEAEMALARKEFELRVVSYQELQGENTILKRDLQNLGIQQNKMHLDCDMLNERQNELDTRSVQLAEQYLRETVKAVVRAVGPANFAACKRRLLETITHCREIGFKISSTEESRLLTELKTEFENEVKREFEREEQSRIKAQIREEERLRREVDRELQQADRERAAIQAALNQALALAQSQHTAEVQILQTKLAEAEEKCRRAISMAQQTKAGHIYVISNVGSFGEGVFKVGMTRRLEPLERITELSCASVPFPFDVHMMISCDNAPALENALHRGLHRERINRVRPRKEFFKTDIATICEIVRQHHGQVEYIANAEALEYRQSQTISDEDAEYIEKVYDEAEGHSERILDD